MDMVVATAPEAVADVPDGVTRAVAPGHPPGASGAGPAGTVSLVPERRRSAAAT
ncbi:hypothetical protein ACFU6M_25810 [Streptomyces bottropensis]|uniref:hypothetical protein n=1 Tax=Streptomyces bottropensis TaxID=42235 RepID=UPI0036B6312D